jgi:hypothetical protein
MIYIQTFLIEEHVLMNQSFKEWVKRVLPNVRLATINDADALSRLNFEFNGGEKRPVAVIIQSLNSSNELVAVATSLISFLEEITKLPLKPMN